MYRESFANGNFGYLLYLYLSHILFISILCVAFWITDCLLDVLHKLPHVFFYMVAEREGWESSAADKEVSESQHKDEEFPSEQ